LISHVLYNKDGGALQTTARSGARVEAVNHKRYTPSPQYSGMLQIVDVE